MKWSAGLSRPADHQLLLYNQSVHHVMFFMFKYVAMPYKLVPASPRADRWLSIRDGTVSVFSVDGLSCRISNCRKLPLHDDPGNSPRIHPHSFLPSLLVIIRPDDWTGEGGGTRENTFVKQLPIDELDIYQVEMHWVYITGCVIDLPHLLGSVPGDLLCGRYV